MTQTKTPARILVVDDDEQIADILSIRLESEGYQVDTCGTVIRALDLLARNRYSLVLLDLRLRDGNGVESLPRFRDIDGEVPIFIITAHGDVDSAVQAFSRGANGFIRKPFQDGDLRLQISQAVENYQMKLEVQRLRRLMGDEREIEKIILTRDPSMKRFLEQVRTASTTASSVVIYGESGTGKELVARSLHQLGSRSKGNFVAINCGAVPENLLESELFGYVKGAFTDARENKTGHIVRASGGTLFLDEIGDAPLSIQVRLLRVLQEREVLPLGASAPIKVDVRVIAATHRDLRQLVAEGKFREDLFYRLQVLPLHVPALRERRTDVAYLGNVFANRFAQTHDRKVEGFAPSALVAMQGYSWPGNVRELQNRVEHAIVMGQSGMVTTNDLFPEGMHRLDAVQAPVAATIGATDVIGTSFVVSGGQGVVGGSGMPGSSPSASASAHGSFTGVLENEMATAESAYNSAIAGLDFDGISIRPYKEAKEQFERRYLENLLRHAEGNIARAARMAGKYRTEVYGLIKKYSLDPREFKRS